MFYINARARIRRFAQAQAGTLAKLGCMIKVDCDDGAIDSVELFINFLAEEELADGYFMARVRARVPGFD